MVWHLIIHYGVRALTVGAFLTMLTVACLQQRHVGSRWPGILKGGGAGILLLVLLADTFLFDTLFGLREVDLGRVPVWYPAAAQVGPLGWCLIALGEVVEYLQMRIRDSGAK